MQTLIVAAIAAGLITTPQQGKAYEELARRLADVVYRREAVAQIVAAPSLYVPVLLSWSKNPPSGVPQVELYFGMAQVFGELKTKEAIPFLIKNISVRPILANGNTWMKAAPTIEARLPAVGALIKIGPDASKALIQAYSQLMTAEDRLAAIFAVSRIGDPAARDFLRIAVAMTSNERYWAEEGLKVLDGHR